MKKYVVDASVTLKWIFDEIDSEKAIVLRKEVEGGKMMLFAPDLWVYEVVSVTTTAIRRGENPSRVKRLLSDIVAARPNLIPMVNLSKEIVLNAVKYGISSYDSAYITLAMDLGLVLVTADKVLTNKIGNRKIVVMLSDL